MNFTAGDITEAKEPADEWYIRGTQSSAKRKPYIPRKVMNIRPLNLNGIKKELEEALDEEENQNVIVNFSNGDEIETCKEEEKLKDISNNLETERNRTEVESSDKLLQPDKRNSTFVKSNLNVIPEMKENNSRCGQKNDSFDLDFTALSISTPVKKHEVSYITPSTNILKVIKPEQTMKEQFDKFVTPKVKDIVSKPQSTLVKNQRLWTPVKFNSPPTKMDVTPRTAISNPSSSAPTKDNIHRNEVIQFSPLYNLSNSKFNIIKVKNTEYIVLNMLGKGGSSVVFQCYDAAKQSHIAIKCVSLQNPSSASGYINEVKLLQQLQKCDKIIKMYDYEILESQNQLLVVLEKGGEDLSAILKHLATQRSHIPMYMLLFYWMEMLYAVKQIHSHGVIHSDLKPSNFLKADGGLKLIDFGIASSVQTDMTSVIKTTTEGSCNYISPEALNTDSGANAGNQNSTNPRYKLHFKSDVWSLGCILYQLVYRRTPFQHIPQLWPKLAAIMNPEHKIDYPEANWVSPKILSTIRKCLQFNIKSRPSVDELIAEYESILHNI